MLNEAEIAEIKQEIEKLQREMRELGPVMRGSVVKIGTRTKQYYFSLNRDKKTHLIFLGKKRVERAKEYSANYKRLLEIVEEMTTLVMKLLKADVQLGEPEK